MANLRSWLQAEKRPEVRERIEFLSRQAQERIAEKRQANAELRKMPNIGRTEDRPENDVSRLSDAELVQQLSDQANQLGVKIDLSYSFLQQKSDDERQG